MAKTLPPVFDSLVMAAVAEEIRGTLVGAHVAGVGQPEAHSISLLLRAGGAGRALLCSIDPRWARCLVLPPARAKILHPFAQQLRARLSGGRLASAEVAWFDRVLTLRFETLSGLLALILEVMGRHSNLILVDDTRVAGVFKPVTPSMSRTRPVLPGDRYEPVPRMRPTPDEIAISDLRRVLAGGAPVSEVLIKNVLGISPPVAAHLARQAGLDPTRPAPPDAADALARGLEGLAAILRTRAFAPTLYLDAAGRPAAYAAIPLLPYAHLAARPAEGISVAVSVYVDEHAQVQGREEARRALLVRIDRAGARLGRTETETASRLAEAEGADRWRRFGELLLAYQRQVPPNAASVTVPDFEGDPLTIPLNPLQGAVGNAQGFFRRYRKASSGREALRARLDALRADVAYLAQIKVMAEQAGTAEEIVALGEELPVRQSRRRPSRKDRPAAKPAPREFVAPDGLRILAGRSNRENDYVTFTLAAPDDLWLHARGMPGAHVILRTDGRPPTPSAIQTAASVAAFYSAGRNAGKVEVDATARRHVRKPKGARPGMVTYREEQTLLVEPKLP